MTSPNAKVTRDEARTWNLEESHRHLFVENNTWLVSMPRDNPVGWFVGLLLLVFGFIVGGLIIGGAIEDGLQRAADQLGSISPIVPVVVAIIIFVGGLLAFIEFFGDLRNHSGL